MLIRVGGECCAAMKDTVGHNCVVGLLPLRPSGDMDIGPSHKANYLPYFRIFSGFHRFKTHAIPYLLKI